MKKIYSYAEAINSGLDYILKKIPNSVVVGQGVDRPGGVFGTTDGLIGKYSNKRVIDFPICESLMTSSAIGMANRKLRPILVHQRIDFAMYSFDALFNWIATWRFKSGGTSTLPLVIRAIIGRGWGQGPQHSKPLYPLLSGIPGIKLVMPTTPFDAKGILIASALSNDPVIIIEHRSLYGLKEEIPVDGYAVELDHERIRNIGEKLTIACIGDASNLILKIIEKNKNLKNKIELIDLVGIYPLTITKIVKSLKKTKKLIIIESCWDSLGVGHKVLNKIIKECNEKKIKLEKEPMLIGLPESHIPTSHYNESQFYLDENTLLKAIRNKL